MPETHKHSFARSFAAMMDEGIERVNDRLERALPPADAIPGWLHEAMRYAVLNGGKRVRPLFVYASGECLAIPMEKLDPPAVAIELIHAFSLVHDDLPAMDDDDLRRGKPTVHRQFDEATAILAADALQPLAFEVLSTSAALSPSESMCLVQMIAGACGSLGMTGGQSIDLASEGMELSADDLEQMHRLKTGALIEASVMSATCLDAELDAERHDALAAFAHDIGLAFQIRDDILDIDGETGVIGKTTGADQRLAKATWPALFGLEESRRKCDELLQSGLHHLQVFGSDAEPLQVLARFVVDRVR